MPVYYTKDELKLAIEKRKTRPNFLFDFMLDDDKRGFTCCKDHIDFFKHCEKIEIDGKYYVNEIVADGVPRKPYMDLEKYYTDKQEFEKEHNTLIKKLQKDLIVLFKKEYNVIITVNDILLLDASRRLPDKRYKFSIHVIISPKDVTLYYMSSKPMENNTAYHLYTSMINMDSSYANDNFLDKNVYRKDPYLRIINAAKDFNDNKNILNPINPKTFEIMNLINKQKVNYFISYIDPSKEKILLKTPQIEQTTKIKTQITKNAPTNTNINKILLEFVKKYHPTAVYNKTYESVYHNFNYTNRNELCPISNKIHSGKNGFYVIENERGYYLKCHSSDCKGSIHIGYSDDSDGILDNAKTINQQYLIDGDIDKKPKQEIKELIKEWLSDDKNKTLAIKSAMGTGKTTLVHEILRYFGPIKILWISYRQTLTNQIYGSFETHGFKNYMEKEKSLFNYDKVIVQIDSLMRIIGYEEEKILFNKYDLVVIDEIEGGLNHFSSPFLEKTDSGARDIFNFMIKCIEMAKKLLVLDADISIRTKLFIDNFGKPIVINNEYMPQKKKFVITNYKASFEDKIMSSLKNKKNVCVVSMSAAAVECLAEKLKDIKYVLHTSKTDDKLKEELRDVNNFWIKYQCVLYSPTIESGVDFNKEHFDEIYCILKNGQMTCSQRGFLQMVGRIRKVKSNEIICFYSGLTNDNSVLYTYDDVLSYFRYYEDLNGKKIFRNVEWDSVEENGVVKLTKKIKDVSLFDKIMIYNEVEQLNKNSEAFMTVLKKLIQRKGHELEFKIVAEVENKKDVKEKKIEDKFCEIDLNKYDMLDLIKRQNKSKLNEEEKVVIQKYFFVKTFNVDSDTEHKDLLKEFIKKFHSKENSIRRFQKMFGYTPPKEEDDLDTMNDGKEKMRHKIIFDLVNRFLGNTHEKYNSSELVAITINGDEYDKAMKDIAENSIYFKDEKKNRLLFFKSKGNYAPINEKNKQFYANTVKTLLESYNIIIKRGKRKKIKNKLSYEYSLSVDEQIKNIVEYKFGKINQISGRYSKIFVKK